MNSELKDFQWSACKPQGHSLLGTVDIPRSIRAAAGIACAAAALFLLFSSHPSHTLVSTSNVSVDDLPITRSIDRPILKHWPPTLVRKLDERSLNAQTSRTQSAATLRFTPQMPQKITTGWGKLSLQRLATNDFLAARNSHRFLKEVTLATISFGGADTTRNSDNGTAAINQIELKTKFAERWITVEDGFWQGPNRPQ